MAKPPLVLVCYIPGSKVGNKVPSLQDDDPGWSPSDGSNRQEAGQALLSREKVVPAAMMNALFRWRRSDHSSGAPSPFCHTLPLPHLRTLSEQVGNRPQGISLVEYGNLSRLIRRRSTAAKAARFSLFPEFQF